MKRVVAVNGLLVCNYIQLPILWSLVANGRLPVTLYPFRLYQ
jgi:hypothetical protein